jgi:hypothetical protein
MTKHDRTSALFLVGIAVAICVESVRIDPGSFSTPGSGLLPLGCGLLIGIIGFIMLGLSLRASDRKEEKPLWGPGTNWWNIISVFVSLMGYAFLMDPLGFHFITFLWIGFVCRGIGKMGWKATLFASFVTTFVSYLIFEHYLNIRFPRGLLGF